MLRQGEVRISSLWIQHPFVGLFYENEIGVKNFGCAFSYMSHHQWVLLCFNRHTGGKEGRKEVLGCFLHSSADLS